MASNTGPRWRGGSLAQIIGAGTLGVALALALLCAGWLGLLKQLNEHKARLYIDALALQADHVMALAVTNARQKADAWRATKNPARLQEARAEESRAQAQVSLLSRNVTSAEERRSGALGLAARRVAARLAAACKHFPKYLGAGRSLSSGDFGGAPRAQHAADAGLV